MRLGVGGAVGIELRGGGLGDGGKGVGRRGLFGRVAGV